MSIEKDKSKPSLLAQWKNRKQKNNPVSKISPRPADQAIPLSGGQQRLWLLQQLKPDNPFYQYAHAYHFEGKLDAAVLIKSIQRVIDRHEILRSNYVETEEGVRMLIKDSAKLEIERYDLNKEAENEQQEKAKAITNNFAKRTFDLKNDLLVRLALIQFSENVNTLLLSIHHIVGDRASLLLMNQEIFSIYDKLIKAENSTLPPLEIQYPDYSFWQKKQSTKKEDIEYWQQQLAGELPLLSLPKDFKRPKQASFKGKVYNHLLPSELSTKISFLTKELQTTPYVLMLSAFKVLLHRYTGQNDLLVGSPFGNRDKTALENLVGFFNETLVLRTQLSSEWTFSELVENLKKTSLNALAHKNMPFEELVKTLQPERFGSANPIFQVMFLYNNIADANYSVSALDIKEETIDLGVSKFDLTLFVNEGKEQLELSMEYALDLFTEVTIAQLLRHLENILQAVVEDKNLTIGSLPIMDKEEIKLITEQWNDTSWEAPVYHSIHQRIEEMAREFPTKTAVTFLDKSITYAQLKEQSDRLVKVLLEKKESGSAPIGLYTERSINMVVGIIAILKSGAAYLPLDPNYPEERISYMLADAGVKLVVAQDDLVEKLEANSTRIISIEKSLSTDTNSDTALPSVSSDQDAYIIYTSGSTGKPKGVPISHENLLHSTLARFSFYPENPSAFLLLSSFSFDSSVVGIFWTLASGGKLVLPPNRIEQDVVMLSELVESEQVSHTLLLPSLYATILDHAPLEKLRSLKNVMVAGEVCPLSLSNNHLTKLPETKLYNEYGPTEASVWCIAHQITGAEKEFIPIGKAIPNTSVFILDKELQAVPIGVSGELYIGGKGLSKGYLNRPELTAEKFLTSPFDSAERIYKTGDLARFRKSGQIEFLGRVDHQVKIRGFRVELEEIQKIILQQQGVTEALVMLHRKDQEAAPQKLVAYLTSSESSNWNGFKSILGTQLPEYMVPDFIIPLAKFPRLPNGKINRKKLPAPTDNNTSTTTTFVSPAGELEIKLAQIWSTVLKIDNIGRTDNFFSIGGDSILSIQIVAKARAADILLTPNQIFEQQTIAELASSISSEAPAVPSPALIIDNPTSYPLSPLQHAFLFNSQREEEDQGQLILEFELQGDLDVSLFQRAWKTSVKRHDIMRAYVRSEGGETAIQVIAEEVDSEWELLDWSNLSQEEQQKSLAEYRSSEATKKLNLAEAPTFRIGLIKLSKTENLLIWVCHHLFLDGWSCGIVLKEAMEYYHSLQLNNNTSTNPIPNYLSFLKWRDELDKTDANTFWKNKLANFNSPLLFSNNSSTKSTISEYKDISLQLNESETQALRNFCKENQITSSSLYQGIWAMLLGEFFQTKDVLYGLTVTGRFADFPQIESISGLFMNILPNRFKLQPRDGFTDWLKVLQKEQGQQNAFDYLPLDEIQQASNWPVHQPLFESLFVFGNFLKDGLEIGDLAISDFHGGFSSNYPLTIHINPKAAVEINWRYDNQKLSEVTVQWFKNAFAKIITILLQIRDRDTLESVISNIDKKPKSSELQESSPTNSLSKTLLHFEDYEGPRNQTETDLILLFQNLFNLEQIGIHDNYFDLGGNSLMALQLFARIEKEMGEVLPPATLFKSPTVAQIALLIDNKQEDQNTQNASLVALRKQGNKPPLFCLHGGGGHVFFYQNMTKHLPDDQPVYTLQPSGLDGQAERHSTIREMATDYIKAIKSVQAHGPYRILGTCFSNAVALEIGHQLLAAGESIANLFIIDSAPVHLFGDDPSGKGKKWTRFYDMLKRGDFSRIKTRVKRHLAMSREKEMPQQVVTETASEKNLRLTIDSLNKLYSEYNWHPLDNEIQFIRSSEFHNRKDKKYHLTQWNKLAPKGVSVHVVEGSHLTLFEEPEVKGLAAQIEKLLK